MYSPETKTITTERLILRLYKISDAQRVCELCNNYNIYKSTLTLPYPYPIESALAWIPTHYENFVNDRLYELAVTDKATGELFGAISLTNNQRYKNGEIAYWIGEEYWGNGYATEALKALIDFAFLEKGYHRVWGRFFASNPSSGKVMQKVGMVKEGVQVEHIIKDGEFHDLVLYGILNYAN
ncbi:MAG: GNAT family N-acetyltransferase [Defluviitaleaceae bacterium]|nr:GNAT family N-acetyltransferase [Defluviitaleaceae bacterium]